MYVFAFDKYAWFDRVFLYNWDCKSWDLLKQYDSFFLCLWKNISFEEIYKYEVFWDFELIKKNFITKKTLWIVHIMVQKYLTTYTNVIKLFVPDFDISYIIKNIISKTKKIDQFLYLYPDLWTIMNVFDDWFFDWNKNILLSSMMTKKQKIIAWWKIKNWLISNIFSTHGEMFQDWKNLKQIKIEDKYKRYYKNQKDPRYNTNSVIDVFKKNYWI